MKAYIFKELKIRFSYCILNFLLLFCIFFYYSEEFLYFFLKPNLIYFSPNFIFTQLNEVLWVFYKLSLYGTFYNTIPFIVSQILLFLIPGLYKNEIKFLSVFFYLFILFEYFLLFLFWYYIFPFLCNFLLTFEQKDFNTFINIFFEGRLKEYILILLSLYWYLFLISLIMFIFFCWCLNMNILKVYHLLQSRKYIYMGFLILITGLISYDFVSLCTIFIFFILFFEFINLCIFIKLLCF